MTERENVLSLFRRLGYERAPISMDLCPSLSIKFEDWKREHAALIADGYLQEPWENLWAPPHRTDTERFYPYYAPEMLADPSVHIDNNGVGHRSTPTSMHMTQMLHPLCGADSLEHLLEPEVPVENVLAYVDACRRFKG